MSNMFNLDEKNDILKNQYGNKKNFFIQEVGKSNVCYIFCSSNGIYYPNTEDAFSRTIIEKDRYEWQGVAATDEVLESAGKIIYVRDIYKQYYVKGINICIDSIEKLCSFLKTQVGGMKIITCGTSSGGYLATILGIYLHAACVFNFGGQWSLYEGLDSAKVNDNLEKSYYFLNKYREDNRYNCYYNIIDLLENNTIPIMYFYSALNNGDNEQKMYLDEVSAENVYCFAMKSSVHGYTLFHSCYRKVITSPVEKLVTVCERYQNKVIPLWKICFCFMDKKEAIKECIYDIINNHKTLQWMCKIMKRPNDVFFF